MGKFWEIVGWSIFIAEVIIYLVVMYKYVN